MTYTTILIFLFIILSFSNFLYVKFNIENNQSFFISCCIIIIFTFLSFYLDKLYNLNTLDQIFYFILFFSILFFLYLIPKFSLILKENNFDFIIIFLIIFYFTKDRYYLDQDEFRYWGVSLKELLLGLQPYNNFVHHPKGTSLFQYLLVFLNFKESFAIFANNILLISGFFFMFYERKLLIFEKIFLFLIFYLLLNNLSFGFLSIYSDPILALFFSCLLKVVYLFFSKKKQVNLFFFIFSIIFISLILINRASPIYGLFILILVLFFSLKENFNTKSFFLIVVFFLFALGFLNLIKYLLLGSYEPAVLAQNSIIFLKHSIFSKDFLTLFTSSIYFSNFGSIINGILSFFSLNYIFPSFQIPLFIYIFLFLLLFLSFNFKNKLSFFFFSISFILIYSIVVFILKFNIEKISILALQRYIGILVLSLYLFLLFVISYNYKKIHNNYIIIFFVFLLISVSPKKSVGFFMPDKVYYSDSKNNNFKINRTKIIQMISNTNFDNLFLIHENDFSDVTNDNISGSHTFYYDIIKYEAYPRSVRVIEYNDFVKYIDFYRRVESEKYLFIFFEISDVKIKELNFFTNYAVLRTY